MPYACNFLSIGCDFTRWVIEIEYPLGYASSGDTLFRDTGTFWRKTLIPAKIAKIGWKKRKSYQKISGGKSKFTSKNFVVND